MNSTVRISMAEAQAMEGRDLRHLARLKVLDEARGLRLNLSTVRVGEPEAVIDGWVVPFSGTPLANGLAGATIEEELEPDERPAHPSYVLWFGAWAVWWIGSELFRGLIPDAWRWWFPAGFLAFGVVEAAGAVRKAVEADTWSEFHYKIGGGLPARDAILRASGWAFALRCATLPILLDPDLVGRTPDWVLALPWWVLCGGLGLWLDHHCPDQGKTG